MSTTLYPISNLPSFQRNEAESDPIHTAACTVAGVDPEDEEVSVAEIDRDEAIEAIKAAGNRLPAFDQVEGGAYADRFFAVSGLDQGYCRLVHFRLDALCVPACGCPRRV
jgi:hypothetical protein